MRRDIKLICLLHELKRNWKIILIIGIIGGLLFASRYVQNSKQQLNSLKYASTCVIQVLEPEDVKSEDGAVSINEQVDLKDNNIAMIVCDEVLNAVLEGSDNCPYTSIKELRSNIFCVGSSYGKIVNVIVLTEKQELSDEICTLIQKKAVDYLNENGKVAELLQSTSDYGPANVIRSRRTDYPEVVNTLLEPAAVPSVSITAIIKSAIKGFILFGFSAYVLICLIYIIKGILMYSEEIEDFGVNLIGTVKNNTIEKDVKSIKSLLSLSGNENVRILICGNSINDPDRISVYEKAGFIINTDGTANVMNNGPDDSAIILLVRRGCVRIEEFLSVIHMIEKGEKKVVGAVFEE